VVDYEMDPGRSRDGANPDVIVIGAGLGGLYAHHRLRRLGLKIVGFEAAPEVGGTWYWNRYPGARCDVESLEYSYGFSEDLVAAWRWSERFATQPEILSYVNFVADRFDLRRDITFGVRVVRAAYDEAERLWAVFTDDGREVRSRFLITTVGCLSLPKTPEFPGLEDFGGRWVQTAAWPQDGVELRGKRVAVIGTGSSGMQSIPCIAREAAQILVFQRTANFSVPANNGPIDPEHEAGVLADPGTYRAHLKTTKSGQRAPLRTSLSALEASEDRRREMLEAAWNYGAFSILSVFRDTLSNPEANRLVADFVREKIRAVVKDPDIAERLCPGDYPIGAKRLVLDTHYWATFNRTNVELVDVRAAPIERITPAGIKTANKEYPVDLIVFATGFDAITGPLLALNLEGAGGVTLADAWRDGPVSYLGLTIPGFPNLFTVNGPGSPSVLVNMILAIEHHVDLIADCIRQMMERGCHRVEAEPAAAEAWAAEVRALADRTLMPAADSWYVGANVPGKPRVFLAYVGGFDTYHARCEQIVAEGYRGLRFDGAPARPAGQVGPKLARAGGH